MAIAPFADHKSNVELDVVRLRYEIEIALLNESADGYITKDWLALKVSTNFIYRSDDPDLINRIVKNEFLRAGWVNVEFQINAIKILRHVVLTRD